MKIDDIVNCLTQQMESNPPVFVLSRYQGADHP